MTHISIIGNKNALYTSGVVWPPNLRSLSITGANLRSVPDISGLTSLATLNLDSNNIETLQDLDLRMTTGVSFLFNPITKVYNVSLGNNIQEVSVATT
ncbi:hypothetical protein SDRG_04072 [Saprolegnia diclina VS20]|uniref:Uncharacterized protein n=1 Tax=Saprolegnia diclina (strain VS20) TaxID=1156394 RepID=T0S0B4_SAPDV|nr:hypothetical protein SDRG_04072 [Saprolegnia diclina VS20]EQC38358.1 hypothetical protein SDRG_04072 [Saprolegnia diclina VS20]|eukprot:XP_008607950.1 hypothetical protein SDRG_04072 [Saprolegnia diclina VS20]